AAAVVGLDALFSATEGYLARPPYYDGAGYMLFGRTEYELIRGLHLNTVYHLLVNAITPGWNTVLALQYLVLGAGAWQAFAVRFWPVALLLLLVFWIVSRRAPRSLAIVATVLTALVPVISAGVRSSSLEFLSGYSNYLENWYLEDLRPDLLAMALILWSVAILAEHSAAPTRATYIASAVFAALAVLIKPSTSPLLLLVWAGALTVVWFVTVFLVRRRLGPAELIYGAVALVFYLVFGIATTRNTQLPEWTSMALWVYVWAGTARLAAGLRWPSPRLEPSLLGAAGLYVLIVYGVGAFAVVNWPANEHASAVQMSLVTSQLAG